MKDYKTWKKEYIAGDISRKYISESDLQKTYQEVVVLLSEKSEKSDPETQKTSESSASISSLFNHRNNLRIKSAYPTLRKIMIYQIIIFYLQL